MTSLLDPSTPSESGGADPRRLPSGRHSLPREFVIRSQRDRLLDAMAEVCASNGYGAATVAAVTARAGVSRKTFYEYFSDREACFLAAYDAILGRFFDQVIGAYRLPERPWPERVRAALAQLLSFLAAEPAFARMCIVEVVTAGPRALERYMSAVRLLARLLDEGRGERPGHEDLPTSTAFAVIHGSALVIRDQILAGRTEQLSELLPDLLYTALVPYVGQEEALRRASAPGERA
jgi:AcrR family transcriptional regulator